MDGQLYHKLSMVTYFQVCVIRGMSLEKMPVCVIQGMSLKKMPVCVIQGMSLEKMPYMRCYNIGVWYFFSYKTGFPHPKQPQKSRSVIRLLDRSRFLGSFF